MWTVLALRLKNLKRQGCRVVERDNGKNLLEKPRHNLSPFRFNLLRSGAKEDVGRGSKAADPMKLSTDDMTVVVPAAENIVWLVQDPAPKLQPIA